MNLATRLKPRVLLIEDEPAVLNVLKATIDYGGFESTEASTAFEALGLLRDQKFDSVLLDLGLPDAEGGHLIHEIRRSSDVPILVVSGDHSEKSKIAALDAGADDFVQKPFLPGELLARIRAALRRGQSERAANTPAHPAEVRTGGIGSSPRPTLKDGSKEKKLLDYFNKNRDLVATNDDIIEAVWSGDENRSEKNVRVLVTMLRRKLRAQHSPLDIINEHGRGYRLIDSSAP